MVESRLQVGVGEDWILRLCQDDAGPSVNHLETSSARCTKAKVSARLLIESASDLLRKSELVPFGRFSP